MGDSSLAAQKSVIAVVVTHNRPDELILVVNALQAQTLCPMQILVFDNASSLPAIDVLVGFAGLNIIRSITNIGGAGGFAFALNEALKLGCDWVWMMDDDAVPRPNALAVLVEAAEQLPCNTGALCSAVYEFGSLAPMHRRTYDLWFGLERSISVPDDEYGYREIDTGSFVGFMVRSVAVMAVGLPDKDFFLAYDDTEYSLRLKSLGWSLWLVPGSEIDHLRSTESRLRVSPFGGKHFYNIRNRLHVSRRYSRFGFVVAVAMGAGIWLSAKNSMNRTAFKLFLRALADGFTGKLGKVNV